MSTMPDPHQSEGAPDSSGLLFGLAELALTLPRPQSHAEAIRLARTLDTLASGLVNAATRLRSGCSAEGKGVQAAIVSEQLHQVDALDLEPIVYKLMHPEPDTDGLSLARADRDVELYRCFLKLCVLHPGTTLVPTRQLDNVWHAHLLDTAKYRADCDRVFGRFLDHFPYFGLGGYAERQAWRRDFNQTRRLFKEHFRVEIGGQAAASVCTNHGDGSDCCVGPVRPDAGRPRPNRAHADAEPVSAER